MIRYRSFRNSDPPALADVWRSQAPLHRLAQPMSSAMWEQYVLSKTFFDPKGLIVATENARPIGFVHVGFCPSTAGEKLESGCGVISRIMVGPHADRGAILGELLSAAEHYLAKEGAREAVVGNADALGPFYLGLYGSSRLAGLLDSDELQAFFLAAGYQPIGERFIFQRSLQGFRPPVDRDQLKHKKLHQMIRCDDPVADNWWEANVTSHLDRTAFQLIPKVGGPAIVQAITVHLHAFSCAWGVQAAGFEEISATSEAWLNGTATCLMAEAMKALQCQGIMLMEGVVDDLGSPVGRVLTTLGFKVVDHGLILKKSLAAVQ